MGGSWQDPMFEEEEEATAKGTSGVVVEMLEAVGLRCSRCRGWRNSTVEVFDKETIVKNPAGGLLLTNPLYKKEKVRTCRCGHKMFACTFLSPFA